MLSDRERLTIITNIMRDHLTSVHKTMRSSLWGIDLAGCKKLHTEIHEALDEAHKGKTKGGHNAN